MRNQNFFKVATVIFVCFVCFYSANSQAGEHDQLVNDAEWAAVKKAVLNPQELAEIYRRISLIEAGDPNRVADVAHLRDEVAHFIEELKTILGDFDPEAETVSRRLNRLEERVAEVEDDLAEVKVKVFYIHFAPGGNSSVENSPDAAAVLAGLQDEKYTSVLRIVGNASTEWDGLPETEADKKNTALAMDRAKAVSKYLSSAGLEVPNEEELSAVVSNRYGKGADSRVVAIYATR